MGFWQYAVSPRRQISQVPSSPPKNPTPTRWPTCQVVTRRPTSSTRPIASCPIDVQGLPCLRSQEFRERRQRECATRRRPSWLTLHTPLFCPSCSRVLI